MINLSIRQNEGYYHCNSITMNFGSDVWEGGLVKMPSELFDKWVRIYPQLNGTVTPDQYEKWTLIVSLCEVSGSCRCHYPME